MKVFVAAALVSALVLPTDAFAQARGRGASRPGAVKTTSVRISVRDRAGANLEGVRVTLSGDASGDYTTAGAGTVVIPDMKDGTYRVRAERDGFITLEREFTVKGGGLSTVDIVLSEAPPPPPPPKAPEPPPVALPPPGSAVSVSIPDYLDRNFIGREPIKESILACKPSETVRLLQLRDNVAQHAHDKMDEVIYVVAGEGSIRIGEETTPLKPGSLAVVPRGSGHAIERKGRNPLIVLSTLSGAPCQTSQQ